MPYVQNLICLLGTAIIFLRGVASYGEVNRAKEIKCSSKSCYRYYNNRTAPYFIESWPGVQFDTGEFYSGSIPIDENDPSRTLFFIFKPSMVTPVDEITKWLSGGPGCSSILGFSQENGPILWRPGTIHPRQNEWTWAKLTNMLWVDQPVGTGFSTGKVEARNEIDVAIEFMGFFKNWQKLFGIKNYKIYVTGESDAGRFVPYISAHMLDKNDSEFFDLSGALMHSPCIGNCYLLGGIAPTYRFVNANNEVFTLNDTFMADLKRVSTDCGWGAYMDEYLQFPPPKNQPTGDHYNFTDECNTSDMFSDAITALNPCFNLYHVTDYCPNLYDPLFGKHRYFNRRDVKEAIHAPLNISWFRCTDYRRNVFVGGLDRSQPPIRAVLPQVIETTNHVLIAGGDWDGAQYTNMTMLSIQNMTWNGKLGFQEVPNADFIVTEKLRLYGSQGILGKKHFERGLMWVEVYQSGHEISQYQPRAAWQHLEWLLGRIDDL